ncbi:hypothetical protein [Roseimaritima ulvae]|uniref:Uncharacterized protein n=1 Tax=Roseimaritima ulvae TaxID=980254 RepID=A0A5B9QKL7_9BACT|nr:hypothetical protein [Roseimaritima ulvae]QEG38539.1 hypothetical protein UC8_04960 [Roseimaritima ulvae]
MKPIMMIALFTGLLVFTGCATHRGGGGHCNSCQSGQCGSSDCNGNCQGGGGGLFGKLGNGGCQSCQSCQGGVPVGCRPGPLHWQQGGLDYSAGLSQGICNNGGGQVVNPGPPSGTVAYPYYTHRGPRDFLLDNPPSIGR